jgi:hypothetical protein
MRGQTIEADFYFMEPIEDNIAGYFTYSLLNYKITLNVTLKEINKSGKTAFIVN